jgi:hypothetical protein
MSDSITQNMFPGLKGTLLPLGQGITHNALVNGDLCSFDNGHVVPLSPSLPFGGIVNVIGEQGGRHWVSTLVHGTISVPIAGPSLDVKLGSKIYAMVDGRSESFSLDGPGTVIGTLVQVEDVDQAIGMVRLWTSDKLTNDSRTRNILVKHNLEARGS